jgi:hypothetical protein
VGWQFTIVAQVSSLKQFIAPFARNGHSETIVEKVLRTAEWTRFFAWDEIIAKLHRSARQRYVAANRNAGVLRLRLRMSAKKQTDATAMRSQFRASVEALG